MVRSYASQKHDNFLGAQAARLGLRRQFERNRDPLHAQQLDDLKKTEAQRRTEGVEQEETAQAEAKAPEKLTPELKPPPHMRGAVRSPSPMGTVQTPVTAKSTASNLKAQRDAAFANVPKSPPQLKATPTMQRDLSQTYNRSTPTQSI